MNDALHPALLPQGLRDLLPPEAGWEADVVTRLTAILVGNGYERVKPPLAEYEENLLSGAGAVMAKEIFRVMDPVSQRMIGLCADMTPQIARIAATRMRHAPRPLRLCYSGQVLRTKGSQIRPERQLGQVGAELIGSDEAAADVEVVAVAAEAIMELGITGLSVDLTLPGLVATTCRELGLCDGECDAVRVALDRRDAPAIAAIGGRVGAVFGALLQAAGPAKSAVPALRGLDLSAAAATECRRLIEVAEALQARLPGLGVTIDPVEQRGSDYETGLGFTFFACGPASELGRGGRYSTESGEPATGFTLYTDAILLAEPAQPAERRLFVPAGGDTATTRRCRTTGWVTVLALGPVDDDAAEAARLRCSHRLDGEAIVAVG
jgi:ATP phosphoribosyltransferase regulatory subunit